MSETQVFVDPYIVALPKDEDQETYRKYFNAINLWLACLVDNEGNYSTSKECIYGLIDEGRFPWYQIIKDIISKYDLYEYTDYDVSNKLRLLSENGPFIEERTGIAAIVTEILDFEPELILNRIGKGIRNSLTNALSIGIIAQKDIFPKDSLAFGTVDIDEENKYLAIKTNIELIERVDGDIEKINELFVENIRFILKPDELYDQKIDEILADPNKALEFIYVEQFQPAKSETMANIPISVGPSFIKSLHDLNLQKKNSILYKIYYYALLALFKKLHFLKGAKLHAVRVSQAADAPQIEREGAKKWRCQLSKHGAGYRLQYWSYPDGSIELDAVMIESEIE